MNIPICRTKYTKLSRCFIITRETAVAAKKNFAENLANIAHQLKTPITAAFLSLQLMEKEIPGALRRTGKAAVETIKPSGRISAYAFQN